MRKPKLHELRKDDYSDYCLAIPEKNDDGVDNVFDFNDDYDNYYDDYDK